MTKKFPGGKGRVTSVLLVKAWCLVFLYNSAQTICCVSFHA